jgi:phosphatidyl-myo-inositol dimannoside synthase
VMPNIPVGGDMEGFGLVAVESACRGALVLAAALEGITDAVVDGETGILVEPGHSERFVETIRALAADRDQLAALAAEYQQEALERFSVDRMARELRAAIGLS